MLRLDGVDIYETYTEYGNKRLHYNQIFVAEDLHYNQIFVAEDLNEAQLEDTLFNNEIYVRKVYVGKWEKYDGGSAEA